MEDPDFFQAVQRQIEGLVRLTGQAKYFDEVLPRLLAAYAEAGQVSTDSEHYASVNEMLWLSGWYVSDYRLASETLGSETLGT